MSWIFLFSIESHSLASTVVASSVDDGRRSDLLVG